MTYSELKENYGDDYFDYERDQMSAGEEVLDIQEWYKEIYLREKIIIDEENFKEWEIRLKNMKKKGYLINKTSIF